MFTKHIFVRIHTGLLCITDFLGSISTKNCVHRFIYICIWYEYKDLPWLGGWQVAICCRTALVICSCGAIGSTSRSEVTSNESCIVSHGVFPNPQSADYDAQSIPSTCSSHNSQSRVTGTDPSVSRSPLTTNNKNNSRRATGSIDGVYRIRRLRVHA